MFQYAAKVLRIIDGDTLVLDVDLGFKIHTEINARLARINAPDVLNYGLNGVEDVAAKYVIQRCPPGSVCVVNISRAEKYGRWLAELFYKPGVFDRDVIIKSGSCLNDEMVRDGIALPYAGGKK